MGFLKYSSILFAALITYGCSTIVDENAPPVQTLAASETKFLLDICREHLSGQNTDSRFQSNGYTFETNAFKTRLPGTAHTKTLIGSDQGKGVEVSLPEKRCIILFGINRSHDDGFAQRVRQEFAERFNEEEFRYSGFKKQGPFGFRSTWESYTSDKEILLITVKLNVRDSELIVRIKEFEEET